MLHVIMREAPMKSESKKTYSVETHGGEEWVHQELPWQSLGELLDRQVFASVAAAKFVWECTGAGTRKSVRTAA